MSDGRYTYNTADKVWKALAGEAAKAAWAQMEAGTKFDEDKSRVDLLDAAWMEEVGHVLRFGAKKYAAHNWRNGISISRLIGAALRHIFAAMRGEDKDPESGLSHFAHASCCLMFAHWMYSNRKDLDDRWKPNE